MPRLHPLILFLALALVALNTNLSAAIPQFSARTLDGDLISDDSLRGRVVLVQFWATWCGYCRRDQPIVDELEQRFADKGLLVLAVNVGEPEPLVRAYLSEHPRSTRVVLNSAVNLASRMGAQGFPFYVAIDAQGRVVGTQAGSGGEASLLHLLARAGISSGSSPSVTQASNSSRDRSKPLMINIPQSFSATPSKPRLKTVFVLSSGERLESDEYTIDSTSVLVTCDGKKRTIPLTALDMAATKDANRKRGITLPIPDSPNQLVLSF